VLVAATARVLGRAGHPMQVAASAVSCRDLVASVLAERWRQMSLGTAGYALLQATLLWACLHAVGASAAPAVVLAGFAADRVMTFAVVTPGALGFVEAGTAAALIALGGNPAAVAAGVLLYRGFTFALEVPVGGAWLAGWLFLRRRAPALVPAGLG
jgi:putative heme transporter